MPDRRFSVADPPAPDHALDDDASLHYAWDNGLDPALTVAPGDVVEFGCRDAYDRQLPREPTVDDVRAVETDGHPLTGPVAIEGAEPGDTLRVDLLGFEHEGWGVSAVPPGERGGGLLPEEFPDPHVRAWDLDCEADGTPVARFADEDAPDVAVPLAPFPGNLGVAPAADGPHDTMPPRAVGGNVDVKHLTAGATLYLPVETEGALFSVGDCHAAQGDGEVCITGIEAPMSVTARFDVLGDRAVTAPEFETTGPFTPTGRDEPMYATTGIAPDLMEATKEAVRRMIAHLHDRRGFAREDAYVLCSAAVDLKISEVVDAPNWTVTAYLPESVLA
ncbi:acetamidase/formamidase family protein [Candidatus Halobonum tyrrellensis]|uniref:Acetamidase/formamidase n=1 Tax=Candidatus Halobonum tyrrellensis G22 TaxID=1324957 RepID=V4HDA9_9EURY|nr:acetamidase/formamidase family protein [Candidatus Halobonum tyrrellensis]ESP88053.1 acetamidase/formamidase [Candidatus Halobonum tyrrellensis G22]